MNTFRNITLTAALAMLISFCAYTQQLTKEQEAKLNELISKMTLEEKAGQMTQITIQTISKKQGTKDQKHELDDKKLEEAITKYHVGSILNVFDVAHDIEYWHEIITKIQTAATEKTRLGIPVIYGIDAIHGATYTKGATLFPQGLALASTWNTGLAKMIGDVTAIETAASGIYWNFNPVLDLGRQPLWPRLWETYGEDVYLAQQLGGAYIYGSQNNPLVGKDRFVTCLKHYVGYSFPFNGLDRTPAYMSERTLREYFLPPFEAGVKAGSKTVMVNSGEIDGIPGHANHFLLTDVLRGELKFDGFVVSDWEDIKRLYTRDRVADSPKEAVRMAVMAGVDMSMVPTDYSFYEYVVELAKEGKLPMWRIDEAVKRILAVKMGMGLFENAFPDKELKKHFATEEHTKQNLEAATESIILLKNKDNTLPLAKNKKVFVTGPTANMLSVLNGGWTITWQGNEETLYPQEKFTILEAIQSEIPKAQVSYAEGVTFDKEGKTDEAVKLAGSSDVVILCLGEPAYCETPGNIYDLTLPDAQINYAKKLKAAGKKLVVVLVQGRPRVMNEIAEIADAIMVGFLPGMEGGRAIADILFGDANPSGKLPVTYPKSPNGITFYDYKPIEKFDANGYKPQFEFGFGLSYTTFAYANLKLSSNEISENGTLTVTVDVKNTGKIKGKEVVQLYLTDLFGSVSRPNRQIKGFDKIELAPGETKTVSFTVNKDHLSFIGRENKRIVEPGRFLVNIAGLEKEFELK
ncbi:MAG: glycoside hydrolase family 3 C-terminal domain-containing protein [Ignavibacteriaceae bacterium]|nr:glycoside hydrolase family 3 C-terminal domain-containing protein [Ignavibacteriaceae bacterium]